VLLKFITKFIRSSGLFVIFFFSIFFIFGSLFVRDLNTTSLATRFLDFTISFEDRFYDWRMREHLNPKAMSEKVALVKIDDYSLAKIGTWPIPRELHAKMIQKLMHFGARVVALDILYPEKSQACGGSSPDETLAQSIRDFQSTSDGRVFLGYTTASSLEESLSEVPMEMFNDSVLTRSSSEANMRPYRLGKYTFPIDELVKTEVGLGSIAMEEDGDGVFRHYLMILNIDTIYFGSLGFNAWEAYTGKKHEVKIFDDASGELEIEGKKLEINHRGEVKLRFFGGLENFASVSLADLLNTSEDDQKLKQLLHDKIVFVGSTATGAHDLRSSPIDPKMPGVLAHMNMVQMLLDKRFFKDSNESVKFSLLILFVGMLIFYLAQKAQSAVLDLVVVILLLGGSFFADSTYFLPQGYELKLFYIYFCFISSYSWNTFLKFSEASKEKKQIKGAFSRYVAPTIVDEMLQHPEHLHVGGVKKDITCLFSDVRDFTAISEGLSAVDLANSLNLYMGRMTDIVFENKGTLDKYIGDAIVALWGAPLDIGNHAQFAVESAVKMIEAMPSINEEFRALGRPEFRVGIGINSGECNVGNMGSERIFSYTALGDNMNLGARLEGLCKYYGTQILISQFTQERLEDGAFKIRPIDKVIVKGKTAGVEIFEVLAPGHPLCEDPEALEFYLLGHRKFKMKNFLEAQEILGQLLMAHPKDMPTQRLYELCKKYIQRPELVDDHFDVTKMSEK
jgi:adenylate cyclase